MALLIFFLICSFTEASDWRFIYSADTFEKCDYKCNIINPLPSNNTWVITSPFDMPYCHDYSGAISVTPVNASPTYLAFESVNVLVSDDYGIAQYFKYPGCHQSPIALDYLSNSCYSTANITLIYNSSTYYYWKKCYCFTGRHGPCKCDT